MRNFSGDEHGRGVKGASFRADEKCASIEVASSSSDDLPISPSVMVAASRQLRAMVGVRAPADMIDEAYTAKSVERLVLAQDRVPHFGVRLPTPPTRSNSWTETLSCPLS